MMTALLLAANEKAASLDITSVLQDQVLQFGLLGLVFLCLVFRKFLVQEWVLKQAEDRAQAEKEELNRRLTEAKEQLEKLQDVFQDRMIPALTRATEINARYNEELQRARFAGREKPPSGSED